MCDATDMSAMVPVGDGQLGNHAAGPSIRAKVVRGAAWVFGARILGRGLQLAMLVVLARLLSPEDFGLFGIVMLAIATLQTFTRTGFNSALIQRKDDARPYLDTAWTVQVVRGLVLAGILFCVAPVVGWLFAEPRAVPLLRVMCASVLLHGFANVATIYFRKDLEFQKQFVYDLVPAVLSLAVGVVLAYRLRSVWALIWAGISRDAVRCILSYFIHPYRPRMRLDGGQARELFRFGRWILGSSVLILLGTQGDDAFVGKVLGTAALGIYQMAYRISNLAATEIAHTISAVTFPGYSKIQDDIPRFRQAYLRVLDVTMWLAAPIAVGTAALASPFVGAVMGAKWMAAVTPIRFLCAFGFLRAFGATNGAVLYASGNPRYETRITALQVTLMAAFIWPATRAWGLPGVCVAVVGPMIVSQAYDLWLVSGLLGIDRVVMLSYVFRPLGAAMVMTAPAAVIAHLLPHSLWPACLAILPGMAGYAALALNRIRRGGPGVYPQSRGSK